MQHRTLARAMLIGVAALGAWTATELADDHAAHADTPPPAVTIQRPGGPLGDAVKLPDKAADRARAAVAKVTAEPTTPAEPKPEPCEDQPAEPEPSKPAEPDPTTEPEPSDKPAEDKPAQDKPRHEPTPPVEAPPTDEPPVEAPPVEVPVPVELPPGPPPVEVPPLPAPPPVPAPTPTPAPVPTPSTDPVPPAPDPLPDTDGGTAPKPQDLPLPVPAPVVVPDPLPVVVGPVPAAEPPAGSVVEHLVAELTGSPGQPLCADNPDDARRIDRDALRALLARYNDQPVDVATAQTRGGPGCPGTPDRDAAPGAVQVKPPTQSAADTFVADVAGSHVAPVLARLEHTRARSHLPAGSPQHIEPSPA